MLLAQLELISRMPCPALSFESTDIGDRAFNFLSTPDISITSLWCASLPHTIVATRWLGSRKLTQDGDHA